MFIQTIDDDLVDTKFITCVSDENNYIICKLLSKDSYQLYYSENIDYSMKEKLSRLISMKKLTTDVYNQEQLIKDMK